MPGGPDGSRLLRVLDGRPCCEPGRLFGKVYSVKAVFIDTRAERLFIMHSAPSSHFPSPGEVAVGAGMSIGWMGGCPPLLDSARLLGRGSVGPADGWCDGHSNPRKLILPRGYGEMAQQRPRGTLQIRSKSHVSPSLSWSHSLRSERLCSS